LKEPQLATPVAFIIFNRPETTARVFAAIAKARPAKLLLIADGPRADHPEDAAKCAATRAVVQRVDWPCEVLTNFSETNLGCKTRPASGLNWAFENVEEAIILEDDCLPHPTFFRYCEELLEHYRDDERVMMISGTNLLGEWKSENQSYQFTNWGGNWGWASWRRAWRFFDGELKSWPEVRDSRFLHDWFHDSELAAYWEKIFDAVYNGDVDSTWDYQWLLACWIQHGLRVFPEKNLVSNIGFDSDATHTSGDSPMANIPAHEQRFPLRHPTAMIRCVAADQQLQEKFYSAGVTPSLASRLKGRVARHLKLVSSTKSV
jgi:hypothetical protein